VCGLAACSAQGWATRAQAARALDGAGVRHACAGGADARQAGVEERGKAAWVQAVRATACGVDTARAEADAVRHGSRRERAEPGSGRTRAGASAGAGASANRSGCDSGTGTGGAGIESPSVLGTRWAQPEGGSTTGGVGEAVGDGAGAELRARDAAVRRLGADPHGENNGAARERRQRPLRRKPRTKSSGTVNCSWRTEVAWPGWQWKV
jgi:hypothetical protein